MDNFDKLIQDKINQTELPNSNEAWNDFLNYKAKTIVFTADFIASVGNIPLPYIPSFDTRPLISMEEKAEFLKEAADNNYILLFQHDYTNECCTVVNTEKGVRVKDIFRFAEI